MHAAIFAEIFCFCFWDQLRQNYVRKLVQTYMCLRGFCCYITAVFYIFKSKFAMLVICCCVWVECVVRQCPTTKGISIQNQLTCFCTSRCSVSHEGKKGKKTVLMLTRFCHAGRRCLDHCWAVTVRNGEVQLVSLGTRNVVLCMSSETFVFIQKISLQ